nr:uncharacterized protein LOC113824029 [Penaeus vannamei]
MIILHNVNDDDKNGDCTINSTDNLNRCVDKNNNDKRLNQHPSDILRHALSASPDPKASLFRQVQPPARPGDRRQQQHQLHAVRARQPARLRSVGVPGQPRLGLRPCAALFQVLGGQCQPDARRQLRKSPQARGPGLVSISIKPPRMKWMGAACQDARRSSE